MLARSLIDSARAPSPRWTSWVGVCLSLLEKNEEALVWFRKAIALEPLLASAHYGAFKTLQALDRPQEAQAAFDEKVRLEEHPLVRVL